MKAAEATYSQGDQKILEHNAELVEGDQTKCNASRVLYSMLARYTGSEAATMVWTITGLDCVETRCRLHASYSSKTLERVFGVQREACASHFFSLFDWEYYAACSNMLSVTVSRCT